MFNKCPGQDERKVKPENINCPQCGYPAEIFSDEIKTTCPKCKNLICRDRLPSCLDWCKSAKECVGYQVYNDYIHQKFSTIKEKLLKEMEDYFGADIKRINHAKKVMKFSEELLKEEGADSNIVIPASILHDVGIKVAEKKYGSSAGNLQEKEGPAIAKKILLKLGLKGSDIEEICAIIAHHHSPGIIKTNNFKVLYDADWLVNFKDELKIEGQEKIKDMIEKIFLTKTGKKLATQLYIV